MVKNDIQKGKNLSKYREVLLKIPWRLSKENLDCGVYCMRHMETYRGEGDKWDNGIKKDDVSC